MDGIELGLHGGTVPQATLLEGLRAAAAAGFNAYEPEVVRVEACTSFQIEEAITVRKTLGMKFLPLNELEVFGDLGIERAKEIFSLAQRLSIEAVTLIPAFKKDTISFTEGVAVVKRLAELARSHRVSLHFEMLCFPGRPFNSFADSLRLAEACGIKLVIDTFHCLAAGAAPKDVARLPKETIGVVHITDALTEGKRYEELVDADRVLPGEGGLPLVEIMEAIRQTGYRGGMSVEVFHPKYAKRNVAAVAGEAHQRAVELLRASGWGKEGAA